MTDNCKKPIFKEIALKLVAFLLVFGGASQSLFAQCNPPVNLEAVANGSNVILTWNAVPNALSYNIYRQGTIIANGVTTTTFTASGMSAGYHCFTVRTVCNSGVSGDSNQACATVEGPCYAPSNLVATSGVSDISLVWTGVTAAGSYNIYRDGVYVGNTTQITYTDTPANGIYCYNVTSVCTGGESAFSNESCASKGPCDAPTGLTATVNGTTISLTWTGSQTATSYNVFHGGALLVSNIQSTAYTISNLAVGNHCYTVTSNCYDGESDHSTEACGFVSGPCFAPQNLQVSTGTDFATLTWNASSTAVSYNVYRDGAQIASDITELTYTNNNLANGTYCFTVTSNCEGSESEPSNEACGSTGPCSEPSELSATVNGFDIALSWTGTQTAVSYNIYRDGVLVMPGVISTSFTFENLSAGQHCYTVTSVCGGSNESGPSNEACGVITTPCDAPTDVQATIFDNLNVRLSWSPTSSAVSYNVYREDSLIAANTFSIPFVDYNVPSGVICYKVTSNCPQGGESSFSSSSCITISCIDPSDLTAYASDDKIILSWTASPTCSTYNVYRGGELLAENVASTSYTDNDLTAGEYCYRIKGVCNNGELTGFTDLACATITTCDAPQGLTAETYLSNIILNWQPTMCDSYRIYMGSTMIASNVTETSFTHQHLAPGTHCYTVKSVCGTDESDPSDQACATIESCYRPVDLTAVEDDANVSLTWGDALTAKSYNVYRNNSLIATDINGTAYQDNGLLTGQYCYTVTGVCYDGSESGHSSEACVTVAICDAPSNLSVTFENTNITLNWTASAVAAGYKIYRDGMLISYTTATTYLDPEMPIGDYCYYVSAVCYTGESDPTETECVTIYGPCMPPTELTAYEEGDFVIMSWAPSQTVQSHQIFVDGVMKMAGIVGDSYELSTENIVPGTHCFTLASICPNGISIHADSVCILTGGPCEPPTDVMLDVIDRKTILTWSPFANAISYSIIRDSVEVGTTSLTHFMEENLQNGIYSYFVKSVCTNGESILSDTISFEIGAGVGDNLDEACHVYPNPTNGMLNVKMKGMTHIAISNVVGQVVYESSILADEAFVDMNQYDNGIYMIRIHSEYGYVVKRVVLVP